MHTLVCLQLIVWLPSHSNHYFRTEDNCISMSVSWVTYIYMVSLKDHCHDAMVRCSHHNQGGESSQGGGEQSCVGGEQS